MNVRQKILLDRVIGPPCVLVLGLLARLLGKVLGRDHSAQKKNVRTIVVSKFLGMGSILQATPMMKELKLAFPEARLIVLSTAGNQGLLERLDFVDEWILVSDRNLLSMVTSTASAILLMQRRRVDLYFDLEVYSALSCIVSLFSLARNRYSFYRHSAEFKRGISTHLMYFNTRRPVRMIYLQLGRLAGIPERETLPIGPIRVTDEDGAAVAERLLQLGGLAADDKFTIINPNASDLMLERRWPPEKYAAVIDELVARGHRVVLVGAPNERPHVEKVVGLTRPESRTRLVNTAGLLKLGELFAILQRAQCVITNDSGPMHMAVSVGTPTVCLFGPVDPTHYGFDSEPLVATIYQPVYCSPCVHEADTAPCGGNNICMQLIQPDAVLAAHKRLVEGRSVDPLASRAINYSDFQRRPLGSVVWKMTHLEARERPCEVCGRRQFILLFDRDGQHIHRCLRCRLERSDPQPADEALGQFHGKHDGDSKGPGQEFLRRSIGLLADLRKGERLLACGAAAGNLMEVAKGLGLDPYGIELSDSGSSGIERKFGSGRAFRGRLEDAEFPSLGAGAFDVVTMFDFLEHVRDPGSALRKAHSMLKPGGKLLICVPNAGSLSHRLMGSSWPHYGTEHLYHFTPDNLAALLRKIGFSGVREHRAWRLRNLRGLAQQLNARRHWLFTPMVNTSVLLLPFLCRRDFPVLFGEMIVEAKKA